MFVKHQTQKIPFPKNLSLLMLLFELFFVSLSGILTMRAIGFEGFRVILNVSNWQSYIYMVVKAPEVCPCLKFCGRENKG